MSTAISSSSFIFVSPINIIKALLVIISVSVLTVIKFLSKIVSETKPNKNLQLPPGPKPWPLVGNLPEMIRNKPAFRWIDQIMKEMNTDICLIRLGQINVVPIKCPILAREVLKKKDAIFCSRPKIFSAKCMSGNYLTTIVTPNNDQWKKMRKILISEIVHPARHQWLHDKRVEEADNLVFYLHNQYKSNKNVNIRIATRHYAGNVIRKLIFGKKYFGKGMPDGGPGAEEIKHIDAVFDALKYLYSFCISDYMPILQGLDLDGQEKMTLDANKTIRYHQNPLIDERIQQWKSGERKEMDDLLDVFITLKDSDGKPLLTPDEIKNQIAEIMIATVDNPSNAVEWAMAEMLNQPEILRKATEELDKVVGKDRLVQESDIPNLNYIKACIREAFRIHPIAYFIPPHVATQDTTIGGFFIPKGSWAILSRGALGRNPNMWPNPFKFDPERHLSGSEVVLTEHDLKFITFSTGRRGCVAALLGSCMTTMLLARMLQCFTWSPAGSCVRVDLSEAADELFTANPIMALAEPRLAPHLYPTLS